MKALLCLLLPVFLFAQTPSTDSLKIISSAGDSSGNNIIVSEAPTMPEVIQYYKDWSFGILYVPYNSGTIYKGIKSGDYFNNYTVTAESNSSINMEAQFAYAITEKLRLTFDLGYIMFSDETEYRYRENREGAPLYYSGDKSINELKMLSLNAGIKYYFKRFMDYAVNIFVQAGLGKQFAFATLKNENLYPQPISSTKTDNIEEYLQDINSPFFFNVGFGAEYMFNQSLSLFSSMRFSYSTANAKREQGSQYQAGDYLATTEDTVSDFVTHIGLGINFYF